MLEKTTKNDFTKVEKLQLQKLHFVSDEVHKQPLKMEINYRATRKAPNFASKPVEPQTKLLSKKIHKYLRPIQTETHNPKRIYFSLERKIS